MTYSQSFLREQVYRLEVPHVLRVEKHISEDGVATFDFDWVAGEQDALECDALGVVGVQRAV